MSTYTRTAVFISQTSRRISIEYSIRFLQQQFVHLTIYCLNYSINDTGNKGT
jgi:hypothetical protein